MKKPDCFGISDSGSELCDTCTFWDDCIKKTLQEDMKKEKATVFNKIDTCIRCNYPIGKTEFYNQNGLCDLCYEIEEK